MDRELDQDEYYDDHPHGPNRYGSYGQYPIRSGGYSNASFRFHTKIAGITFENRQSRIKYIEVGQELKLVREQNNAYDKNAIAIYCTEGQLGYVAKEISLNISPLIDSGAKFKCYVSAITGIGTYSNIGVNVIVERIDNYGSSLFQQKKDDTDYNYFGVNKDSEDECKSFVSYVSGITYSSRLSCKKFEVGHILRLIREPENKDDRKAVAIYSENGLLGYIPSKINSSLSIMMDRGIKYVCVVSETTGSEFKNYRVRVEVERVEKDNDVESAAKSFSNRIVTRIANEANKSNDVAIDSKITSPNNFLLEQPGSIIQHEQAIKVPNINEETRIAPNSYVPTTNKPHDAGIQKEIIMPNSDNNTHVNQKNDKPETTSEKGHINYKPPEYSLDLDNELLPSKKHKIIVYIIGIIASLAFGTILSFLLLIIADINPINSFIVIELLIWLFSAIIKEKVAEFINRKK